ncbi:MAG: response regulator [Xenococcaceae cyanobacterium MO_188.B29]|nr:response regulator [Xenococcaceae cyanobacterium MO_188.B29]
MIRILIVDDEKLIRQTLEMYLRLESDFEIVGIADNGQTALDLIEKLNPDIVLMDLEMPEMDGCTTTKIICQRFTQTKVLVLSSHSSQEYIYQAFIAGAQGYVLKSMPGEELSEAIKLVHEGYLQMTPKLSFDVVSAGELLDSSLETINSSSEMVLKEIDTKKQRWEEQKIIKPEQVISLPPNADEPISSDHKNLQLNQNQPELSSLPLAKTNESSPTISPWIIRGGILMLAFFGAFIILASIFKHKVTVRADGQILPTGELGLVSTAVAGKVKSIKVKENQHVALGETIATISNFQLPTQKQQLEDSIQQTQQQIIQVDIQIGKLERQILAEQHTIDRIISSAQAELNLSQRAYQDRQIITQAEVKEAEATAKLAREEWERYQQLANTGAVSRSQISEKQTALEAALARLERAQVSLNPNSVNVTKAREQIAQEKARGVAKIATLAQEKESLQEKQITLQKQLRRDRQELQKIDNNLQDSNIIAPIAGTIQKLHLRNQQQLLNKGDLIAQIAPSELPLLVKASVASQDIAKVEKDQTVQLRVFACPYPDFGTIEGKVLTISPDISQSQTGDNNPISAQETNSTLDTYEVMIEPVTSFLVKDQQKCQLKSGMKARVDILTKEESILTFILRKARLITQL